MNLLEYIKYFISIIIIPKNDLDPFESYNDLDEEQKLIEACNSHLYRKFISVLNFFLNWNSLSLVPSNQKIDTEPVRNTLVLRRHFTSSPKLLRKSKTLLSIWQSNWLLPVYWLILIYLTLKFSFTALKHFEYSYYLKKQTEELDYRDNNSGCSRLENLANTTKFQDEIDAARRYLIFLGDPTIADGGGPVVAHSFFALVLIIFYLIPMFEVYGQPMVVDYLGFIRDPIAFKDQSKEIIAEIIKDTIESLENKTASIKLELQENHFGDKFNSMLVHLNHLYAAQSHLLVFRTNLVRPINLSSSWYTKLIHLTQWSLITGSTVTVSLGLCLAFLIFLIDWYLRAQRRLEIVSCRHNITNAAFLNSMTYLGDKFPTEADLKLYETYDNTILNIFWLVILVELKISSNIRTTIFLTEVCIGCWLYGIAISLFINVYNVQFADKLYVIHQIKDQLSKCITLLELRKERQKHRSTIYSVDDRKLVDLILITYVNFSLFKRRFATFRHATNVLGTRSFIFVTILMGICYCSTKYTICNSVPIPMMHLILVGFVAVVNAYFTLGAVVFNRIRIIMKSITTLVAHGSSGGNNELEFLIDLWRRHLLNQEELNHFFAGSLFGQQLTYENIITINGYLFGVWLVL